MCTSSSAEFEFERSQRGKPILKYQNFRYRRERTCNDITSWRCAHKNCKGRLSIVHATGLILKSTEHDLCFETVRQRQQRKMLKREPIIVVDDNDVFQTPETLLFIKKD